MGERWKVEKENVGLKAAMGARATRATWGALRYYAVLSNARTPVVAGLSSLSRPCAGTNPSSSHPGGERSRHQTTKQSISASPCHWPSSTRELRIAVAFATCMSTNRPVPLVSIYSHSIYHRNNETLTFHFKPSDTTCEIRYMWYPHQLRSLRSLACVPSTSPRRRRSSLLSS